jgi:hypothetical protein
MLLANELFVAPGRLRTMAEGEVYYKPGAHLNCVDIVAWMMVWFLRAGGRFVCLSIYAIALKNQVRRVAPLALQSPMSPDRRWRRIARRETPDEGVSSP